MLVGMKKAGDYYLIGTTRDDAAGEAFDKVAKMLDLPYPGGPEISKLATRGAKMAINFPKPMINSEEFDFSFAGLKTAVLYYIRDHKPLSLQNKADIAASFQESVVQVLVSKLLRAAKIHKARSVFLGGGVSANKELQNRLKNVFEKELPGVKVIIPSIGLFTDNGAMIALAAAPRVIKNDFDNWQDLIADPKLKIN